MVEGRNPLSSDGILIIYRIWKYINDQNAEVLKHAPCNMCIVYIMLFNNI